MTLRYSIDGGASWVTLEDFEVRIAGHTAVLSLESVSVTPERLEPGKPAELALRLRNNADVLLKNIRVNLQFRTVYQTTTALQQTDLPFTAVGSSNEKELAQLTPGASGEVAFRIIVDGDASSGVYKVPIGLTYLDRDGNAYSVEETQIGLVVEAPVAYALALKDRDLYTSGNGEVVLSLSSTVSATRSSPRGSPTSGTWRATTSRPPRSPSMPRGARSCSCRSASATGTASTSSTRATKSCRCRCTAHPLRSASAWCRAAAPDGY